MVAHFPAKDVRHVLERSGLVGRGHEEPDEGEREGVEAGEEAEQAAVRPADAEGGEQGEEAGAAEIDKGGPGHADFAAFVGEYLGVEKGGRRLERERVREGKKNGG